MRETEQAAGVGEVVGGGVEPGRPPARWSRPAAAIGDEQPADPEVGAGASGLARRSSARRPRTRSRPTATRSDGQRAAGPSRGGAEGGVEAAARPARPRRGRRRAGHEPTPTQQQADEVARRGRDSAPRARASRRSMRVGGGAALAACAGRSPAAWLLPPDRGRWVVATVATTVPAAPPATGDSVGTASAVAVAGLAGGAVGGASGVDHRAAQLAPQRPHGSPARP